MLALLLEPMLWLAGLVFFLYAPLEGCLHTWGTSYLQNMGHDGAAPSGPWLASGAVFWRGDWWRRSSSTGVCCRRVGIRGWWWSWPCSPRWCWPTWPGRCGATAQAHGLLFLGFFLGPIFPTLVGFLFRVYGNTPGTAFGVMFAIGSAGSVFLAPLIAARCRRRNGRTAMRIPLAWRCYC